jgi:tetratricopeptide (TPR) repeat protein
MLSGTLPFRGGTPAEMLAQRIVASPQGIDRVRADLPPFVVRLVSYLLELRPARRCPSAEALVRAIDERRVPGLAPRTRRLLAALAVALVLAGTGYCVERWRAAQPESVTAVETRVDLAVMPFRAVGDAPDAALAAGIGRQLNAVLLDGARGTLADPTRTARALSALGFDAEGAHSFIDRVADDLRARQLLEGELAREGSGWRISASLRDPAVAEPAWIERVNAADDAAIAPALATLEQRLRERLGAAPRTTPWPDPATLRLAGRHVPALDGALPDTAVAPTDGASLPAWWSLRLEGLDRSARSADAATAAAQAEAALAADNSHAARRLRAYAQLLRGEPAALAALREVAAQAPADFALATLVARAQADDGDLAAAASTLEAVVAADPQTLDAWYLLGKFAIMQGDARRAADQYLVRAQVLANQLRDRRLQADVVNALGLAYRHLGLMDEAVDQFDKAVKLRRALADVRGEAGSLRNLEIGIALFWVLVSE